MTSTATKTIGIIYDYYKESPRLLNPIKPYVGFAQYSGRQASHDLSNHFLRSISQERELSSPSNSVSAYGSIVDCLWDEIIPTKNRTPTHWVDCGYVWGRSVDSILCLPVRLMLPDLSPQTAAIRLAGYLQAVAEQIPTPTWTRTQSISLDFSERYTELMLKGLITGLAHERGYMERLMGSLGL